jgi:hypothetical protein
MVHPLDAAENIKQEALTAPSIIKICYLPGESQDREISKSLKAKTLYAIRPHLNARKIMIDATEKCLHHLHDRCGKWSGSIMHYDQLIRERTLESQHCHPGP